MTDSIEAAAGPNARADDRALVRVAEALRGLRFGAVTIIVHDGIVVQVDRTEKLRLPSPKQP